MWHVSFDVLFFIIVLGLVFDFTNGFHDAANVVATVIATRVLAPIAAILLASLLNLIGATQISAVASTITSGLIHPHFITQYGILSAAIGGIVWNLITWYLGIPSSSSYAIVGGLIGAAWVHAGITSIFWSGLLYKVIIPMIASPIIGFFLGLAFMKSLYLIVCWGWVKKQSKVFKHLQLLSAAGVALSHGFNDAQKSMALITLGLFTSGKVSSLAIPLWVIILCAITMGLGTAAGGYRIIHTVGYGITQLRPVHGFAAETSSCSIILLASFLGFPLSSTHIIVGSVAGVGTAKSMAHVRWELSKKLITAWLLTLPGAACVSALTFYFFAL